MSAATSLRGIRFVVAAIVAVALGAVALVLATVFSAVDYNAQEVVEGALTGPPPLWIMVMSWVAIASMAAGAVALVAAFAFSVVRR